ncbi:piggyBac transposable element-derived protein 4-like [Belonocnema kinseyi]|uniref:piggyBac transposable element-derived protein 4-like n=1 Tax=Belonocnema kinseyi TaxID=2817044 RepID=UPI00143D4774|nr:piggyBac transposable element-derived protein 4-like [Belonocnema kinseyi]
MIVCHTNEEIVRRQALVPNSERYAGQTDTMEIEALIGFLLLCGATKNSDLKLSELFSRKFSIPFYRCVTSLNRMKFLISHLRFDSKETWVERKRNDKFAPFREFWDIFIASCGKYYTPSEYVTADETLLSFRGRCPFKMYLPNTPDKYGLKIVSLCDARTFYFFNGIPYVGRETLIREGSLLLPTCCVIKLCEKIENTNRNVTTDNWFSLYELSEELAQRKLTYVGTMRKNKREIPPELIAVKGTTMTPRDYQKVVDAVQNNQMRRALENGLEKVTITLKSGC